MGKPKRTVSIGVCNIKPVLTILLLTFTAVLVYLSLNKNEKSDVQSPVSFTHLKQYIPERIQYHWNNWMDSEDDEEPENCNYEDYVFGQPVEQTDPCLVAAFKKTMLKSPPPPEERIPINITREMASQIEKAKWIEKLIIQQNGTIIDGENRPGFFIECGANDGTFISPTLRIEKDYNWTGLLIEANPIPYQSLIKKKRNAWSVNAALCTTPNPKQITFYTNPKNTGLSGLNARVEHGVSVNATVQCIPLYTMLLALNMDTVDFLSLDVEGLELDILKTLPFDKVKFKVMTIEHSLIPGKLQALKDYLEPRGYKFVKEIRDSLTEDSLYVHESLYALASSIKI